MLYEWYHPNCFFVPLNEDFNFDFSLLKLKGFFFLRWEDQEKVRKKYVFHFNFILNFLLIYEIEV